MIRAVVAGIPVTDVGYGRCADGINHTYMKTTRLWGNIPAVGPRPMCTLANPGELSRVGGHPSRAPHLNAYKDCRIPLDQLYTLPKKLKDEVAASVIL